MSANAWWRRVYIHQLFLLVLLAYALTGHLSRMWIAFTVVFMHELSHALIAETYGLRVDRIEIWPFGGIARIDGLGSQDPDVEMMVAMAGPIQNFLLAALAWSLEGKVGVPSPLVREFITLNLGLGALNLLPVAPLDGGRLARVYLGRRLGHARAERVVTEAGLWMARGLIGIALLCLAFGRLPFNLAIFSAFLYWGARGQRSQSSYWIIRDLAVRPSRFQQRPIWRVDDLAVRESTPVGKVLEVMRPMHYHRVSVLDSELRPLGVLSEEDLIAGLHHHGPSITVGNLLVVR